MVFDLVLWVFATLLEAVCRDTGLDFWISQISSSGDEVKSKTNMSKGSSFRGPLAQGLLAVRKKILVLIDVPCHCKEIEDSSVKLNGPFQEQNGNKSRIIMISDN